MKPVALWEPEQKKLKFFREGLALAQLHLFWGGLPMSLLWSDPAFFCQLVINEYLERDTEDDLEVLWRFAMAHGFNIDPS